MIQTQGLVLVYAWLIFAGLLSVLAYLVLRSPRDPASEATRRPDRNAVPLDGLSRHPHVTAAPEGGLSPWGEVPPTAELHEDG
jgi:hypothetical protein